MQDTEVTKSLKCEMTIFLGPVSLHIIDTFVWPFVPELDLTFLF